MYALYSVRLDKFMCNMCRLMEISVYAGSIMTAGGNLAWAASTGYPGASLSLCIFNGCWKVEATPKLAD
jgi:hypothetical protein